MAGHSKWANIKHKKAEAAAAAPASTAASAATSSRPQRLRSQALVANSQSVSQGSSPFSRSRANSSANLGTKKMSNTTTTINALDCPGFRCYRKSEYDRQFFKFAMNKDLLPTTYTFRATPISSE